MPESKHYTIDELGRAYGTFGVVGFMGNGLKPVVSKYFGPMAL